MTESVAWVKWHFDKWLTDPGLRKCSLAARGLWMELLCIMHNATPYGHLAVNMKPLSERDVMQFVGSSSLKEVKMLLRELRDAAVFSETSDGFIYSRRLIRDNEMREKSRIYGKTGGNPALKNQRDWVNPIKQGSDLLPLKTEREREKEKEKKGSASRASPDGEAIPIRDSLWRDGVPIVRKLLGYSDSRARSFLGGLLKKSHDDSARIYSALREAESLDPADPAAWLMRAADPKAVNGRPSDSRLQASELILGRRLPGREHLGEPAGDWTSTIEGEFNREP